MLAVFDVSRTHFYGVCERHVYVETTLRIASSWTRGQTQQTMYGTYDVSNAWQKVWGEQIRSNGFDLGASNPALYRSEHVNGF